MSAKTMMAAALAALMAASVGAAPKNKAPVDPAKAAAEKARKEELEKLRKEFGQNDGGYGLYNTQYVKRYGICDAPSLSDEELAASKRRGYEIAGKFLELAPNDAAMHFRLGNMLYFDGRNEEALAHFRKAAELRLEKVKGQPYEYAEALFWQADVLFAMGRRDEAKALLKEILDRKLNTRRKRAPNWSFWASLALRIFDGRNDDDGLQLPRSSDMKAFPNPQQAKYEEKFTTLGKASIRLSGVKGDDARVKLLRTKLGRLGVKTDAADGYPIEIALDASAPVDRPEGYSLAVGEGGAKIAARDLQGVLWGVVSFVQLVDPATARVRHCTISDWPDTRKRGQLTATDPNGIEFALFNKLNSIVLDGCPVDNNNMTPLRTFLAADMARRFRQYGLTVYYYAAWITQYEQIPICFPRTLPFRIEVCKKYAKMGAGVYFPFDDSRYPVDERDLKAFGNASKIDAKHVNDIFLGVIAEYPDFDFIFCPPFYWGPDAQVSYPDDREAYLKSIGDNLDPRVDVYWSGPSVKGLDKKKYQVEWFTKLTKHKPAIFQNAIRPHNLVEYLCDPIPWDKLHYDGFCQDIAVFHNNCNNNGEIGPVGTMADWLWNTAGYDAKRASRAAVTQFNGPLVWEILFEGLEDLSYFDRYRYGTVDANILFEDYEDLKRKYEHAKDCAARAREQAKKNGRGGICGGRYEEAVGWAAGVVAAAKNPPDVLKKYRKDMEATVKLAVEEAKADLGKGDRVLTPVEMGGSRPTSGRFGGKGNWKNRFVKFIRGAQTRNHSLKFSFECDPFPPTGAYGLAVCGIQDELAPDTEISIKVNGNVVYKGPCGFPKLMGEVGTDAADKDFALREFELPLLSLKRHNQVEFSCEQPGYNPSSAPYVGVNYMVLRKPR